MFVLVTGAGSQLGKCLKDLYNEIKLQNSDFKDTWYFADHNKLDITNYDQIEEVFDKCMPDVVVNCAAYTNVEQAEDDFLECNRINCFGVQNLLQVCQKYNTFLITISTDYVYDYPEDLPMIEIKNHRYTLCYFDGYARKEDDKVNPQSNYAFSKVMMETICNKCKGNIVIRTSWLYSQYGHNFMKTIVKKLRKNEDLTVIDDQIGRPTNANNLAQFIMFGIIANKNFDINNDSETYNFQDGGYACSWYDFANEIKRVWNDEISPLNGEYSISKITEAYTDQLSYKAKRPNFSLLDMNKASQLMRPIDWKHSLKDLMIRTYLNKKEEDLI